MTRRSTVRRWLLAVAVALAFAFAWMPGARKAEAASRSATLSVGATVNIRCLILTTPVTFGTYDVFGNNATSPLDGTGGITLNCSQGSGVDVRLGQGTFPAPGSTNANPRRRMGSGAARMSYNLYEDAAYTTVWDNVAKGLKGGKVFPVTLPVYGRVPAGQVVPVGAYADSVVATVFF